MINQYDELYNSFYNSLDMTDKRRVTFLKNILLQQISHETACKLVAVLFTTSNMGNSLKINKTINCEFCGTEIIKTTGSKKYCGTQKDKSSCAYKAMSHKTQVRNTYA